MMFLAIVVFIFVQEKIKLKDRIEKNKNTKHKSSLEKLGEIDD